MPLMDPAIIATYAEFVTVCDTCGAQVSMFTMNDAHRAACVPCRHPARVSLVANQPFDPDAAA